MVLCAARRRDLRTTSMAEEAETSRSSLVAAVLACSGHLEKESLSGRISRLSCRVEELKVRRSGGSDRWAGLVQATPTQTSLLPILGESTEIAFLNMCRVPLALS